MSPAYRPEADRFWEKVTEDDSGCWLWTGAIHKEGYGIFNRARMAGAVRAHRWAYEQMVGEIPEGLVLDHLCRVRSCVNPYHGDPVTDLVNIRRGAKWRGEKCSAGHNLSTDAYICIDSRGYEKRVCRPCRAKKAKAKYHEKKRELVQ